MPSDPTDHVNRSKASNNVEVQVADESKGATAAAKSSYALALVAIMFSCDIA